MQVQTYTRKPIHVNLDLYANKGYVNYIYKLRSEIFLTNRKRHVTGSNLVQILLVFVFNIYSILSKGDIATI